MCLYLRVIFIWSGKMRGRSEVEWPESVIIYEVNIQINIRKYKQNRT